MGGRRFRWSWVVNTAAVLTVGVVALSARLLAVNLLPVDFDEDDYLRAGQQYAVGIQAGDPGVLLRDNYRPEHPPLSKIITGLALLTVPPAAEIPDRPTTAGQAKDLPPDMVLAGRTAQAGFGAAAALVLALFSPLGGLVLALHTWTIKYSSQVMLEAVPALLALLAVGAATRARRGVTGSTPRRAWLAAAAVAFGLACAGKYLYGVAGLAIAADLLWSTRDRASDNRHRLRPRGLAIWLLPVAGWLALGFAVFLAANPYLWPDPIGRLASSIAYHGGYATSAAVQDTGWPMWQPLVWLMGSVPWHEAGTFLLTADLPITLLGALGASQLWRRYRLFALWFLIGFAFLIVWPTKWPQYVLTVSIPLSLSAGLGLGRVLAPVRSRAWGILGAVAARLRREAPAAAARGARGGGLRRSLRNLRGAAPWLAPGFVVLTILAVIPIAYEFLMSLTDVRLNSLKDGLRGGIVREALGGLAGQIPAVPFDIRQAAPDVHYVGADLLNGFQQGFWLGGNTSASYIAFSVVWMVLSVGLQAGLGITVAAVLERPGVRMASLWRTLFILPWAIPEVVAAVAWRDVFHPQQGMIAQALGHPFPWSASPELSLMVLLVASTWMGWPLWMLVATAGMRTIPRAVAEAAQIDGAGAWRRFAGVTLPMLLPLLGAAFVVRAVTAFNQFYLFYVLGPSDATTTLSTFSFFVFSTTSGGIGLMAVSAAINMITMVALTAIVAWFLHWRSHAERVALA